MLCRNTKLICRLLFLIYSTLSFRRGVVRSSPKCVENEAPWEAKLGPLFFLIRPKSFGLPYSSTLVASTTDVCDFLYLCVRWYAGSVYNDIKQNRTEFYAISLDCLWHLIWKHTTEVCINWTQTFFANRKLCFRTQIQNAEWPTSTLNSVTSANYFLK